VTNLVVIENQTIDTLASNAGVVASVPCLKAYRDGKAELRSKSCRRCGQVKNQTANEFYARIKDCLGMTSADGLRPIFDALDTRQLRIIVRRGGKTIKKTIRRS
jgi:hypothetical protein